MDVVAKMIAAKKAANKSVLKDKKWMKRSEREAAEQALSEPSAKVQKVAAESGSVSAATLSGKVSGATDKAASQQQPVASNPPTQHSPPSAANFVPPESSASAREEQPSATDSLRQPQSSTATRGGTADEALAPNAGRPLLGARAAGSPIDVAEADPHSPTLSSVGRAPHSASIGPAQAREAQPEVLGPMAAAAPEVAPGDAPGADSEAAQRSAPGAAAGVVPEGGGVEGEEEDELTREFRQAAERLQAKRKLDAMPMEDKIMHHVKAAMAEWKADLDARPPEAKATSLGKVAQDAFNMTEKAFGGLYARLRARQGIHQEVLMGLWMMIESMQERNYIRANEVYSRVAIGNATWPIGVTSVGIHARSAREKISYYANQTCQAHIMNDEATRKFLQGMKRLLSATQRLHPTDPSRSVDFNAVQHAGLGAKAGAEKQLLLTAQASGETWQSAGLPQAPHYLSKDGSVAVPQTWGNTLRAQEAKRKADPAA